MEDIKSYFYFFPESEFQTIDEMTADDLDVDALFEKLNRTCSPIGAQYLYRQLRCISHHSIVRKYLWFITSCSESQKESGEIAKSLERLQNKDACSIIDFIQTDKEELSQKWLSLLSFIRFLPTVLLGIFLIHQTKVLLIVLLASFIALLMIHFKYKLKLFYYSTSITWLYKMLKVSKELEKSDLVKKLAPNLSNMNQSLKRLYRHTSNFRFNQRMESEIMAFIHFIIEFYRIFTLLEPIGFYKTLHELKKERETLLSVFETLGKVDFLRSIAILHGEELNSCIPDFETNEEGSLLEVSEVRHPLIDNCVSNSLKFSDMNFLILGSNMSGKTTFMRTIGVNVLLAQTLNLCFARRFVLSPMKIYTSIAIADNLQEGKSYYLSEVLRMKEILEKTSQSNNLILLDELFKGTNTPERLAGAKSVLSYLTQNKRNRIIVATHDFELIHLLAEKYKQVYFEETIENRQLLFDYKLKKEMTSAHNAINILELYDFPSEIINEARQALTRDILG